MDWIWIWYNLKFCYSTV